MYRFCMHAETICLRHCTVRSCIYYQNFDVFVCGVMLVKSCSFSTACWETLRSSGWLCIVMYEDKCAVDDKPYSKHVSGYGKTYVMYIELASVICTYALHVICATQTHTLQLLKASSLSAAAAAEADYADRTSPFASLPLPLRSVGCQDRTQLTPIDHALVSGVRSRTKRPLSSADPPPFPMHLFSSFCAPELCTRSKIPHARAA